MECGCEGKELVSLCPSLLMSLQSQSPPLGPLSTAEHRLWVQRSIIPSLFPRSSAALEAFKSKFLQKFSKIQYSLFHLLERIIINLFYTNTNSVITANSCAKGHPGFKAAWWDEVVRDTERWGLGETHQQERRKFQGKKVILGDVET